MLLPFLQKNRLEAGVDEAGRGAYAGPVFAAAVILPSQFYHPLLNDSKKVSAANRDLLRKYIESEAIAWSVAYVTNETIDQINILQASFQAMHLAISQLRLPPAHLLIDGNRFAAYPSIQHTCIVKGDGKYASIAAASILAKTHRDAYMLSIHPQFPEYAWDRNKGYGTLVHRNEITKHGLSIYHRKSFAIS